MRHNTREKLQTFVGKKNTNCSSSKDVIPLAFEHTYDFLS